MDLAGLEDVVDAALQGHAVPGLAVGVWHAGAEHVITRGVSNAELGLGVDDSTVFQTGSTTKTYTALAILRLVERGTLSLEDAVRTHVPELELADPAVAECVTLRHLLTHTAGHEGDLFDDFGGGDDCLERYCAGMGVLPQLAPLGTFTYSNAGFSVLGRVLERATGMVFEDALAELVLDPLGASSSFLRAEDAITHNVAAGHTIDVEGNAAISRIWALPRTSGPAGGLASSVTDQLAYARFHLGDGRSSRGERLVAQSTLTDMRSPQVVAGGGRAAHIGLAWLLQATPGVIAHGGSANGQESAFVIVPDSAFAITVLTNSSHGAAVHGQIVRWALRTIAQVPSASRTAVPARTDGLGDFVGSFTAALEGLAVSIADDGLRLDFVPTAVSEEVFPATLPARGLGLTVLEDDSVQVTSGALKGARGEFLRDDSGEVCWLRIFGRLHLRAS